MAKGHGFQLWVKMGRKWRVCRRCRKNMPSMPKNMPSMPKNMLSMLEIMLNISLIIPIFAPSNLWKWEK